MALLKVENLGLSFAGLQVIKELSFSVEKGSIASLIGPNGAGKTSVFNCLTGFYKPNSGQSIFDGKGVTRKRPYKITRRGMARTFQNLRLFKKMTVLENVMSGMHCRTSAGALGAILRTGAQRREEAEIREFCESCLDFVGILDEKDRTASNLSYGHQRRVEWARALATRPKLLLLDEPAAGLNFDEKQQ
ncbi:MAG: ABC transporter ATP-binding protein, partial [Desulfofustis sp.]